MALIKFGKQEFLEAMEPGIVSFVVHAFEEKLAEKLDGIIQETHDELKKELPDAIKAKVFTAIDPMMDERRIKIEVDLTD